MASKARTKQDGASSGQGGLRNSEWQPPSYPINSHLEVKEPGCISFGDPILQPSSLSKNILHLITGGGIGVSHLVHVGPVDNLWGSR